jgi:hypothetical protein
MIGLSGLLTSSFDAMHETIRLIRASGEEGGSLSPDDHRGKPAQRTGLPVCGRGLLGNGCYDRRKAMPKTVG